VKKKLVFVTIAAVILFSAITANRVLNPFNIGITPLVAANEQEQTGRELEISFSYNRLAIVASNQYLIQ
jgi:hypothetical protein